MSFDLNLLGPLKTLAGKWEGKKGEDRAPDSKRGVENNKFREEMSFYPIGDVVNHEQTLYGLRYRTKAWEGESEEPFHEEVGYWLWDEKNKQVLRSFIVPRGVAVQAGGTANPDDKKFQLSAESGSETYGICSNKFLNEEFKTVRYELSIDIHDENSFSYREVSSLKIKDQKDLFEHSDQNTMTRVN
jgi:hypothetical protein